MEFRRTNARPLVEFLCDGNDQIGFGHIRRSLTLATQLIEDGMDVRISGLSPFSCSILPPPEHVGRKASIVVFDSLTGIEPLIRKAKRSGQISVTLDWFGNFDPDVNIVVYPHGEVRASKAIYIGFEYIIIRNEIISLRFKNTNKNSGNVIICIGGGDLLDQSHLAAKKLSAQNIDVTVIQGPFSRKTKNIYGYACLNNPPNFAQLLYDCNWSVTNGGGCLFEALCLGKASYVLPQTKLEKSIAEFALDRGAVLGIGIDNLRGFRQQEIRHTASKGSKLIDGSGVNRISSIIINLL